MQTTAVVRLLTIVSLNLLVAGHCNGAFPEWVTHKSPVQKVFEEIYPKWFHIHSAAARKAVAVRADIVFDPKQRRVTLDRGRDEPQVQVELPPDMNWHAFQISVQGVRKLSFPVVLQRPNHHERRSVQDDEEVLIIGKNREAQLHFHLGSRTTGVTGGGMGRAEPYYRYSVDEWQNCVSEGFDNTNAQLASQLSQFRELHTRANDGFELDEYELTFVARTNRAILDAMLALKRNETFDADTYLII